MDSSFNLRQPDNSMGMLQTVRSVMDDGAFRFAVKFGMAGVAAVFLALWIRLEDPTWALFTVYVLMIAQYVGAIAEKSVFRLIGTAVGGILGYLLTASFEQQPWIFLPLVAVIVGFCTAMFGQSRFPYAFLLCGLTLVVVTSNGLADPDRSWTFMLWRIEEVSLGIIVTMVVQCIFWPRYARVEFLESARAAFADLRDCFRTSAQCVLRGAAIEATRRAEGFPERITGLRGLLDYGGRESQNFRDHLGTYFEITSCLSRISSAIVTLGDSLPENSLYRPALDPALSALHGAMTDALDDLSSAASSPESRRQAREAMDRAFATLEASLRALREHPLIDTVPTDEAMTMGLHGLALDDIRRQIEHAQDLLDSLPSPNAPRTRDIEPFVSPVPPAFWIRSGIKSGLAVMIALLLDNWLHPPGGTMFVLGAWVFTALNATSPGGHGDRRAFDYLVFTTLAMIAFSLLVILASPMLSSYAVMNTIIFTWLFVWGYHAYAIKGVTIPMQVAMLGSVGLLGLNGQEPVSFQQVAGLFFGIVLGQILAALIQRVLWPSLPQWELRDRLCEFLATSRKVMTEGPANVPLWQKARIALIPAEATLRIHVLRYGVFPQGECGRLEAYLHTLQRIGHHLVATIGALAPLLPPEKAEQGRAMIAQLERTMQDRLVAHESSIRHTTVLEADSGPLAEALQTWQSWVADLRAWTLAQKLPVLDSLRLIGLSGRYELAGRDLLEADRQANALRMTLYMGDYIL